MREIPLSNGGAAIVDDGDFPALSRWTWRRDKKGYAVRSRVDGRHADGRVRIKTVKMHREIMGDVGGIQYDHVDRNKLDNRRANLRPATNQQNSWNSGRRRQAAYTSRFKGVTWKKRHQQWCVKLMHSGRYVHVGLFRSEVDAARAYDAIVRSLRGPFARLNFPNEGEQPALSA